MQKFIVFRAGHGQYIVRAASPADAVQQVLYVADGTAWDWTVHKLSDYNSNLQARLMRESVVLGDQS